MIDESDRLDRIVGNLLSYSRIEAGALRPALEPVDLNELTEATVDRLSHLTRGLKVELRLDPRTPIVESGSSQLDQVLTNLVENAVRHSPVEGCITVETSSAGRFAQLAVIDDGPGIECGRFDGCVRAVRRHELLDGTRAGHVQAIVEAHGGSVDIGERLAKAGACRSASLP